MDKKKIKPEDLELHIEEMGGTKSSSKMTETKTCGFNCNTVDPTLPDCKTIEEAGCLPTQTCWTIEPACETKVGCVDSTSNAELCCPIEKTVDVNCMTNDTCGPNTVNICLVTQNICINPEPFTKEDTCEIPVISKEPSCAYTQCNC